MVTKAGLLSLIAGFFLGVFSGVSGLMESNNYWANLTFFRVLGEKKTEAIITVTDILFIQDALDYFMYELPIFVMLVSLGVVLLVIGMFFKTH